VSWCLRLLVCLAFIAGMTLVRTLSEERPPESKTGWQEIRYNVQKMRLWEMGERYRQSPSEGVKIGRRWGGQIWAPIDKMGNNVRILVDRLSTWMLVEPGQKA